MTKKNCFLCGAEAVDGGTRVKVQEVISGRLYLIYRFFCWNCFFTKRAQEFIVVNNNHGYERYFGWCVGRGELGFCGKPLSWLDEWFGASPSNPFCITHLQVPCDCCGRPASHVCQRNDETSGFPYGRCGKPLCQLHRECLKHSPPDDRKEDEEDELKKYYEFILEVSRLQRERFRK
ncbi:MAG: hypothetical protein KatS3mg098_026 [Candidatus Parcubacteria bacterium]|nr:hypothetical protein [Patescibacteria group bacterium]BCX15797.1 MAG: hypothetical protein KatS3mg098_026 [Candidatus Parcubacteria bacterium]